MGKGMEGQGNGRAREWNGQGERGLKRRLYSVFRDSHSPPFLCPSIPLPIPLGAADDRRWWCSPPAKRHVGRTIDEARHIGFRKFSH